MTRAVLFDLDGTLADTAADLAEALNALLRERGKPTVPVEKTRHMTSSGARGLIGIGFGLKPGDDGYDALRSGFLDHYEHRICVHTRLFPGMTELLAAIEARGLPWGIVTNKAARFTIPLVAALGLSGRAACIVSGDTTPHTKPHPAPMRHAAGTIGLPTEACVYVGDDLRDIQAGRATGMRTVAAAYGYLGDGVAPHEWGADGLVHDPRDILRFL